MADAKSKHAEDRLAEQQRRKRKTGLCQEQITETDGSTPVERRCGRDHMSDEQFDFVMAIDEYKRANARPFPTWTEVLELIKALGYRKVAEPQALAGAQVSHENAEESTSEPVCP